ncbi:MAG: hypothetical protein J6J61_05965 [Muribaculaceae bacterium]|nr:hypothetical protein [Muribaculaceae bacterium]
MEIDFKQYTGTKIIKAAIMGAEEARRYGAQITEETAKKNLGNIGYLVIYPDGYRSWSPKKVFEAAYRVSETHVDRIKIELADLNERICNATRAINTFGAISEEERWFLKKQLDAMWDYAEALYDHIRCAAEPRPRVSSEPCGCKAPTTEEGR